MPARSKAQMRLMKRCAHQKQCPPGLSPTEAAEFTHGQSTKGLPQRVGAKKKKRTKTKKG